MNDFDYLPEDQVYLDSACQSLRPRPVIAALDDYYETHNSCGERVKYKWGKQTDEQIESTRSAVLRYLKLKHRDYFVSFTLNTTYGINLLLTQFQPKLFKQVVTTDIEHNSPFLSTMTFAKKHSIPRVVIDRAADGSIPLDATDWTRSLVVVGCASNIDGRTLINVKDLVKTVHKSGGTIIIDAAQAMAHSPEILSKTEADAICFSGHKMYSASLGVIVARRDIIAKLDDNFIGGGMVDDVDRESYILSATDPAHIHTRFESGLQAFGEIIALGTAIEWLNNLPKSAHSDLFNHTKNFIKFLSSHPRIHLVGETISPTISFYVDDLDSHLLGEALSRERIMARTGYFCCHYYLAHKLGLPPLARFSMGYHTRESDIDRVIATLSKI